MVKDFFAEDMGFKVELCEREELIKSDKNEIVFRLRVTDSKKLKKDKPAHKENEAIQFEFTIGVDNTTEMAQAMYTTGVLQKEDDAKKVAKMMETQIKALAKDRSERIPKGPEPEIDPGQGGRGVDGGVALEGDHEAERGEMDGQLNEAGEGGGSKEPTPPKDRQYQLLQEQQQQYYQDPQYQSQTYQDTGVQYQEQVIQQQQQQYHNMGLQQHMSADQAGGVQHQQQQYQDVQYVEVQQYQDVQNILPQDQYTRHLPTLEEQPRGESHKGAVELETQGINITNLSQNLCLSWSQSTNRNQSNPR